VRREAAEQRGGKTRGHVGPEGAKECAALSDPAQAPLQHPDREPAGTEIAYDQSKQGPIRGDLRAQHRAGEARAQTLVEQGLDQSGRQMQDDQ
jgi:hypothetical protein